MSKLSFLVLVGQKSCARHENRDVKMKKFTLILSVVLGLTIGLKAQNYVGELHGFPACIPSFFTTNRDDKRNNKDNSASGEHPHQGILLPRHNINKA